MVRPHWQTAFIVTGVGTVASVESDGYYLSVGHQYADRADPNSNGNGANAINAYLWGRPESKAM